MYTYIFQGGFQMPILTEQDKEAIIKAYSVDLVPMIKLAEDYGVSRMAIHKMLNKRGVNTKKGAGGGTRVQAKCTQCGKLHERTRSNFRGKNLLFCGHECYYTWLKNGGKEGTEFIAHRHSSRLARELVREVFALQPQHIVHHKDRDERNNKLSNLAVFASAGDHMKHHRGVKVEYLWDGAKTRKGKLGE
jgi:hypothetical protein